MGALVVSILGAASVARAEEDPEVLIRQGVALRRAGDDSKAHGYFKRAYEISHTPRTAAQLGLVEQALGRYLGAQQHLSEALDGNDPWIDQNRALLEKSRESVRGHLGRIDLRGLPNGATCEIGGQAATPVPADGTIWVAPGAVTLKLSAADHESVSKNAVLLAGGSVGLDVTLPSTLATSAPSMPAPAAAAASSGAGAATETAAASPAAGATPAQPVSDSASENDSRATMRLTGLVAAGAGLAVGVTGVFLYLSGTSKENAIKQDAAKQNPYNPSNGDYQTLGNAGLGFMIAGGALVAAGTVLYFLERDSGSATAGAHVAFGYAPGIGGNFQIMGHF